MPWETTALPLLPGSSAWRRWQREKAEERRINKSATTKIDSTQPKVNVENEIDRKGILDEAAQKTRLDLENRFLLNRLSFVYQNGGGIDHINRLPRTDETRRKQGRELLLRDRMEQNLRLATKISNMESEYDHRDMAEDWILNRRKLADKMRYDPQLWRRVFEDQKQVQAKKGRQLDPYYKWQF